MGNSEMAERQAFEALAKHERLADLVALVRAVAEPAADARSGDWRAPAKVQALAAEKKLEGEGEGALVTVARRVVEAGAASAEDRAMARALWAHAVAESPRDTTEEEDRLAARCLWLAAHTPFDATRLLDRAMGDEAADLWAAIAERVRRLDRDDGDDGRAEMLLGAAALAGSTSPAGEKLARSLSAEVTQPALARLLAGAAPEAPPEAMDVEGVLLFAPRGAVATTLLALSGILCVMHLARLAARVALAYERPARVTISAGSVRVRWRTVVLGRELRARDVVLAREGLACVAREVRYPRAAFYAGLFFLALGSFVGVRTLADGVTAASPTLLLAGFAFVALGVLLDFALGSLVPGAAGRCRLFIVPARGRTLCVAQVDAARADDALARLAAIA